MLADPVSVTVAVAVFHTHIVTAQQALGGLAMAAVPDALQ